jgi:hypothetical protein
VGGRNKWLIALVLTGLAYSLVTAAWTGVELARHTVSAYILGSGQTQFVSDGVVSAQLGDPDARTLKVLPVGFGLAPGRPNAQIRPTVTFEASNADIAVHVARIRMRVTLEPTWGGWRISEMDRLP